MIVEVNTTLLPERFSALHMMYPVIVNRPFSFPFLFLPSPFLSCYTYKTQPVETYSSQSINPHKTTTLLTTILSLVRFDLCRKAQHTHLSHDVTIPAPLSLSPYCLFLAIFSHSRIYLR